MQIQRHRRAGTALATVNRMLTAPRVARLRRLLIAPALALAVYVPMRQPIVARADQEPRDSLWEEPADLAAANLFDGPWSGNHAPDPAVTFTFLRPKTHGINPGVVVSDPSGRVWHVKQHAHNDAGAEGPVEVVISRVLSAIGYHQPPVYFLPSFRMTTDPEKRAHTQAGGRFRLRLPSLKDVGSWSWQQNPFVGTQPYQGLLVILLLFNDTDFKDENNTLYRVSIDGGVEHWYVVRDLGAALGETGRFSPRGDDAALYERSRFIAGVRNGFVEFANKSSYQKLFQRRISVADVRWAGRLLGRLSDRQWHDAFLAGGYPPDVADRFIRKIRLNIEEARRLDAAEGP
jgi:hypothetical protein